MLAEFEVDLDPSDDVLTLSCALAYMPEKADKPAIGATPGTFLSLFYVAVLVVLKHFVCLFGFGLALLCFALLGCSLFLDLFLFFLLRVIFLKLNIFGV